MNGLNLFLCILLDFYWKISMEIFENFVIMKFWFVLLLVLIRLKYRYLKETDFF